MVKLIKNLDAEGIFSLCSVAIVAVLICFEAYRTFV